MDKCVEYYIISVSGLPTSVFVISESHVIPRHLFFPLRESILLLIQLLLTIDMLVLITHRSGFAETNHSEAYRELYLQLTLFGFSYTTSFINRMFFTLLANSHTDQKCKLLFTEIWISLIHEQIIGWFSDFFLLTHICVNASILTK